MLSAAPAHPRVQRGADRRPAAAARAAAGIRRDRARARSRSTSRPRYRDRVPGSAGDLQSAGWFRDKMRVFGLPVAGRQLGGEGGGPRHRPHAEPLGGGVAAGQSTDAIVVMAHRDDTGEGPGAGDNASGTAALIELARGYAQPDTPSTQRGPRSCTRSSSSRPTAAPTAASAPSASPRRHPGRDRRGDRPRRARGPTGRRALVLTGDEPRLAVAGTRRDGRAARARAGRPAPGASRRARASSSTSASRSRCYEQGPLAGARHSGGDADDRRRAAAERRSPTSRSGSTACGWPSSAARRSSSCGWLDAGAELAPGTASYVYFGARVRAAAGRSSSCCSRRCLPFLVVSGRPVRALPPPPHPAAAGAAQLPQPRSASGSGSRSLFELFALLGVWPIGAAPCRCRPAQRRRPTGPCSALRRRWRSCVGLGWLVARARLVPRAAGLGDGGARGRRRPRCSRSRVVALLVVATNPFALIFLLPSLHAWLWLPHVRTARRSGRGWPCSAAGFLGPLLAARLARAPLRARPRRAVVPGGARPRSAT